MEGTKSEDCNDIAVEIWQWCISKNIWISAAYISGTDNVIADKSPVFLMIILDGLEIIVYSKNLHHIFQTRY